MIGRPLPRLPRDRRVRTTAHRYARAIAHAVLGTSALTACRAIVGIGTIGDFSPATTADAGIDDSGVQKTDAKGRDSGPRGQDGAAADSGSGTGSSSAGSSSGSNSATSSGSNSVSSSGSTSATSSGSAAGSSSTEGKDAGHDADAGREPSPDAGTDGARVDSGTGLDGTVVILSCANGVPCPAGEVCCQTTTAAAATCTAPDTLDMCASGVTIYCNPANECDSGAVCRVRASVVSNGVANGFQSCLSGNSTAGTAVSCTNAGGQCGAGICGPWSCGGTILLACSSPDEGGTACHEFK